MSADLIIALALCVLAAAAILVAALFAFGQKVYLNESTGAVTQVEVSGLGKFKTNTPAIALCGLGVVLGYFAYDVTKGRGPHYVEFEGEVSIDEGAAPNVRVITVGLASGTWLHTETRSAGTLTVPVKISVPDSWTSYSAYAFALGQAHARPALIGTSRAKPTFQLRIEP